MPPVGPQMMDGAVWTQATKDHLTTDMLREMAAIGWKLQFPDDHQSSLGCVASRAIKMLFGCFRIVSKAIKSRFAILCKQHVMIGRQKQINDLITPIESSPSASQALLAGDEPEKSALQKEEKSLQ
jgi:hypothetical protein